MAGPDLEIWDHTNPTQPRVAPDICRRVPLRSYAQFVAHSSITPESTEPRLKEFLSALSHPWRDGTAPRIGNQVRAELTAQDAGPWTRPGMQGLAQNDRTQAQARALVALVDRGMTKS